MAEMVCPKCRQTISAAENAAFCPFCGERLNEEGPDLTAVRQEQDPVKKYEALLALQRQYPDSLAVAEEILYLGRLYQRGGKGLDFSIIKCYVLNVYLDPGEIRRDRRDELRGEIFSHPDLDRCLELARDRDAFLRRYLGRISEDFIRLFLKGSSRYMRSFFGFAQTSKAPKYLALPAAKMMLAMHRDEGQSPAQRSMLLQAFYVAFSRQMNGETQYLDAELARAGISLENE